MTIIPIIIVLALALSGTTAKTDVKCWNPEDWSITAGPCIGTSSHNSVPQVSIYEDVGNGGVLVVSGTTIYHLDRNLNVMGEHNVTGTTKHRYVNVLKLDHISSTATNTIVKYCSCELTFNMAIPCVSLNVDDGGIDNAGHASLDVATKESVCWNGTKHLVGGGAN
ncbi:uncharacterized protein LOC135826149 [Sycon ciliatum]|uniref:uncharacterized protein LOC135826149 n=1 Tax=Sycon ciliatum TaxID=27933 RepID=UPI0031F6B64A